ncbi:MAG: flavin reductase family protein [Bacillota bacterium]
MEKKEIPLREAYRLLTPGWVILVASQKEGKYNVMTASWQMPVSINPPLVAVSIAKRHLTADYILSTRAFTVNVPGRNLIPLAHYCGSVSGRDTNKFAVTGLSPIPGQKVPAPLIKECLAGLECRLWNTYDGGDHHIVVGEVVAALAAAGDFDKHWLFTSGKDTFPSNHIGGPLYVVPGTMISVSKKDDGFETTEKPLGIDL